MTHKLQFAILFLTSLILLSCGNNHSPSMDLENITDIKVGVEQGNRGSFINLIKDVRFIPLETSNNVLLGSEIAKIACNNSEYYVADKNAIGRLDGIYRFDCNGKFLNKIGNRGRGPGEYVDPTDFVVNSSGVILLDNGARKLLFYDHDGTYKRTVNLEYILYEITGMADENFLFAVAGDNRHRKEADNHEILIINTDGKLEATELPRKYRMNFTSSYKSFLYNGDVLYSRPFHKFVYGVNKNEATVKYSITLTDSPLPANYEEKTGGDFERFMERYEGRYNYFMGNLLENDDIVFFNTLDREGSRYWNVYDKRTGNVNTGIISPSKISLPASAKGMVLMGLRSCLSTEGKDVIGYLNAIYLNHSEGGFRDNFPSLANTTENDNPVIFRFCFQ